MLLPEDPFALFGQPAFAPAARRQMTLFGAPVELLYLPERRARRGSLTVARDRKRGVANQQTFNPSAKCEADREDRVRITQTRNVDVVREDGRIGVGQLVHQAPKPTTATRIPNARAAVPLLGGQKPPLLPVNPICPGARQNVRGRTVVGLPCGARRRRI